jgi:spermidine synthase
MPGKVEHLSRFITILSLCAVVSLFAPSASAQQNVIHEEHSLYRNILVTQNGTERCMLFRARRGLGRESCKDMANPKKFVFEYASMMLASLYLNPHPQRILVVGLGGGTLPEALQEILPNATVHTVEIDPAVESIAEEYFNFVPGPNTENFISDGRVFVKRAQLRGDQYDLIMLDAFEADYIPEHMLTQEFLEEVKSILTPGGIVAANTFSRSALYDYESVTYRAVFGEFFNLKFANRIIIAKKDGLPSMDTIRENSMVYADDLRERDANPDFVLPIFNTRVDWDTTVPILTDQYSPSNVLNTMSR